ncbi:MAG: HAD-IIB family hydrolase [Cyanobacteriota bacterium]|nr:HAD-IIB family hydrolase [Cyanobacteriota bacterium]
MSLLLCTDLDRTLIPNGAAPESPQARLRFRAFILGSPVTLAYVTGRDLTLVQEAIQVYDLPQPHFVIADVGASVYDFRVQGAPQRLQGWDAQIGAAWEGREAQGLIPLLAELMADWPCRLQEPEKQSRYKLSYYLEGELNPEPLLKAVKQRLQGLNLDANLIWSLDEDAGVGLLDILPPGANKSQAIAYLMERQNFSLDNTLFAGDSGNDLDVLLSPIKAALVANAHPQVKEAARRRIAEENRKETLYFAQGAGPGNGNYSDGILEGVAHFFPEIMAGI